MFRIVLAGALASIIAAVDLPQPPIQVSHQLAGTLIEHTVASGETLGSSGARIGVDITTIASMNTLTRVAKLTAGQVLHIDNRHIVPPVAGASVVIGSHSRRGRTRRRNSARAIATAFHAGPRDRRFSM